MLKPDCFKELWIKAVDAIGWTVKMQETFGKCKNWMNTGNLPFTVKYFSSMFNPEILKSTTGGGRYRSIICLLLKNHAKDFRTGQAISTSLMLDENIEDHHIFPDDYLKKEKDLQDWTVRNCALNRALVDELTNSLTLGCSQMITINS